MMNFVQNESKAKPVHPLIITKQSREAISQSSQEIFLKQNELNHVTLY